MDVWQMVDTETGAVVEPSTVRVDFRGTPCMLHRISETPTLYKTGRIFTTETETGHKRWNYPSVFELEIVPVDGE